jgi:hypothetical protein
MPIWRAIHRRIPGISVSQDCPLDRTLELWFKAPDELSQFQPSSPASDPPPSGGSPRPNEGRIYSPAFTQSITPPPQNADPPIPPAMANPAAQAVPEWSSPDLNLSLISLPRSGSTGRSASGIAPTGAGSSNSSSRLRSCA